MPEIVKYNGPINRRIREYLTTDPSVLVYRCSTRQNPIAYFDGGAFRDIDIAHVADSSTMKAGEILLRAKNVVSTGLKKSADTSKFLGLRPDEKQDGSEQLEFTLEKIEIDGKSQPLDLSKNDAISSIAHDLGSLTVMATRQRTRIMVPVTGPIKDFRIQFRIHLTGLMVRYREDLDEYWIYNDFGQFRFRLIRPSIVDPKTLNPILDSNDLPYQGLVQHSLTDNRDGTYIYVKEHTETFREASIQEEFLVDADIVYSSTSDGLVYISGVDWPTVRGAGSGTARSTDTVYSICVAALFLSPLYHCRRSFFYYDFSGLSGTVLSVSDYLFGYYNQESSGIVQHGTQSDPLASDDYDAFDGSSFGSSGAWDSDWWNVVNYNSSGISAVQAALGGTFKTCWREETHDYNNTTPDDTGRNGCCFADYTGTDHDPYLEVTISTGTDKSSSDSGTGADTATALEATLTATVETGTGTDTAASLAAEIAAAADSGTGVDTGVLAVEITVTDSGTGVEAPGTVDLGIDTSDTGTGAEATESLAAAITATAETGTGVDAGTSLAGEIAATETGTGAEAAPTLEAALTATTDSGSGVDVGYLGTPVNTSDAGTGVDGGADLATAFSLNDAGTAVDSSTAPEAVLTGAETGSSSETAHLSAAMAAAPDTGVGAEAPSVLAATLTVSDAGAGTEAAGSPAVTHLRIDAGVGAEALGDRTFLFADAGTGIDAVFYHMAGYRWPHLHVIRERLRGVIDEETPLIWTDDELDRQINDAERDIAAKAMGMVVVTPVSTVAGSRFLHYTGFGIAAVEFLPEGAAEPRTLQRIHPAQLGFLPVRGNNPQYWFPWGGRVCIEPVPVAAHSLNLYEIRHPEREMADEDDEPLLDKEYHELIVPRAAAFALIKTEKFRKSGQLYAGYAVDLQNMRRIAAEQVPDKREGLTRPDRIVTRGR